MNSTATLWLPTLKKEVPRPWFLPDQRSIQEQNRIISSQYFLVRIGGGGAIGEALRCDPARGGCGGKHQYITLRCVEQPFSAITGGLYAYFRAVGDNGLERALAPSERERFEAIKAQVPFSDLPDLTAHHPEMSRGIGLAPTDAQLSALALGVLEPVPYSLAKRYRDRINDKGVRPRFELPGMDR